MDTSRQFHDDEQTKAGSASTPPANGVGFRPQHGGIIKVQPPRREDLQPSYAQTFQTEDLETHGWYGAMSKSHL